VRPEDRTVDEQRRIERIRRLRDREITRRADGEDSRTGGVGETVENAVAYAQHGFRPHAIGNTEAGCEVLIIRPYQPPAQFGRLADGNVGHQNVTQEGKRRVGHSLWDGKVGAGKAGTIYDVAHDISSFPMRRVILITETGGDGQLRANLPFVLAIEV